MPELPEVETQVRDLKKEIKGLTIKDIIPIYKKVLKKPKNFKLFKNSILNKKVLDIERLGKNILIHAGDKVILIHQKIAGHILYSKWIKKGNNYISEDKIIKKDPKNRFLIYLFVFNNGKMLGLCDPRKFSKIELWSRKDIKKIKEIKKLGEDPFSKNFTFNYFYGKIKNKNKPIKSVLLDQSIVLGIGNIYSDEILWQAKVHPTKKAKELSLNEIKEIFKAIKQVLREGIKKRGESFSDWRDIFGKKGNYDKYKKVFKREGLSCKRCKSAILKTKISGRTSRFCSNCQKYD